MLSLHFKKSTLRAKEYIQMEHRGILNRCPYVKGLGWDQ